MKANPKLLPVFPQVISVRDTTDPEKVVFSGQMMIDAFAARFAADAFQLLDKQEMSPNDLAVAERNAVHKAYHRADLMMEIRKKYL